MAILNDIQTQLAKTIQNNVGYQIFAAGSIPDMTQFPAVMCEPGVAPLHFAGQFAYAETSSQLSFTFGAATDQWCINLFVAVPLGSNATVAQQQLNDLITGWGPSSIRKIVHENKDLGLRGTQAVVLGVAKYTGNANINGTPVCGAVLAVRVVTEASNEPAYMQNEN